MNSFIALQFYHVNNNNNNKNNNNKSYYQKHMYIYTNIKKQIYDYVYETSK